MLWQIVFFSVLGGIGAMAASALLLVFPDAIRRRWLPGMISYATGTLLGAAFLGMLPASLARTPASNISATVLAGIVSFFLLEKLILWRHSHDAPAPGSGRAAPLILIGDAIHNFVDGVMIAAAFLASMPLGIATTLAVIAHEIPQEVGDFAILLDSGYGRLRALLLNGLSAATTLPGALAAYFLLDEMRGLVPYILALSAASFIYIATADLIPELHRQGQSRMAAARQFVLLLAGIATIALLQP